MSLVAPNSLPEPYWTILATPHVKYLYLVASSDMRDHPDTKCAGRGAYTTRASITVEDTAIQTTHGRTKTNTTVMRSLTRCAP